jgi:hypothetical protein
LICDDWSVEEDEHGMHDATDICKATFKVCGVVPLSVW